MLREGVTVALVIRTLSWNINGIRNVLAQAGTIMLGVAEILNNFDFVVIYLINLHEPLRTVRPIYIGRAYRYPPYVAFYIYFFPTNISTEYFKHAAHYPFFSSKCRLFHNATFFVSCIIHILHTG
jgi:hypothetical protein